MVQFMRIVFLSNYFNHHQKPLSDALYQLTDEYRFVATSEMREERRQLGYHEPYAPYVIHMNEAQDAGVMKEINEADAVIIGSAPERLIKQRMKERRLTFRYSERPLKSDSTGWKNLVRQFKWRKNNPSNAELYLLSASAFAPADYARFGCFRGKAFRWGYFPETKRYEDFGALVQKKKKHSILWVGRFLDWKHPELALQAVKVLRERGFDVTLDMIGSGDQETALQKMIRENHQEDQIRLLGALPYEKVREYMENAEIFLFTSDRQEGWGAVLNEAMNSGCAAVASHRIGSVPYLMKDGVNGFVYEENNLPMLCDKLEFLLTHDNERKKIAENAYHTIADVWNAQTAAKQLLKLIDALQQRDHTMKLFEDGPCSPAEQINDYWKARCN